MKKFHFPLRPLAVVRAYRELRAREALAAALRERAQAEAALAAAQARVAELAGLMAAGRAVSFRAADQAVFALAYREECAGAADKARLLAAAEGAAAARREACVEANRDLTIVERLEEKARAAHRAAQLRAEQLELDELAGFHAARGKLSS
jgi:flagellar FliJ protein